MAPPPDTTALRDVLRAGLWMTGAIVSFSSMAVAGRAVSPTLDTFEIMAYRSLIGLAIVLVLARVLRLPEVFPKRRAGLQLVRNIAHFTGQNLWFYAVTAIPLAQVFALEFTSPLWVLLLAPIFLGERLTARRVLAALMGFAGILIVTRPGAQTLSPGVIAAAASAVFFALTNLLTKRLTRTEPVIAILTYLTGLQAILGLICAGWDGDMAMPDAQTLPWVLLIACAGLGAHYCLTRALSIAPASVVVPFDFFRLPLIAVIGAVFYAEALDPLVFLGAVVIFAGNYLNILSETRPSRRSRPKPG